MLTAFLITLLAGLSTTIGGLLATHRRMVDRSVLAVALAFAAGAMLFLSFVQIIPTGIESLTTVVDPRLATAYLYGAFFVGVGLVLLVDRLLPESFNPSDIEGREDGLSRREVNSNKKLMRSGALIALVLALHNFPEGMSTFLASYQDIGIGIMLAVAIAVHNIPEGIAVAAPIYAATKNRTKAVW